MLLHFAKLDDVGRRIGRAPSPQKTSTVMAIVIIYLTEYTTTRARARAWRFVWDLPIPQHFRSRRPRRNTSVSNKGGQRDERSDQAAIRRSCKVLDKRKERKKPGNIKNLGLGYQKSKLRGAVREHISRTYKRGKSRRRRRKRKKSDRMQSNRVTLVRLFSFYGTCCCCWRLYTAGSDIRQRFLCWRLEATGFMHALHGGKLLPLG